MTKNQEIAALVQKDIMSRDTTSGNQLSQCIISILDKSYPEGAVKQPTLGEPKKSKGGKKNGK